MILRCPHCGGTVAVHGLGRKPLNITVKNVCDAMEKHHNVAAAANELICSRAYIYKALEENGLDIKNFVDPARQKKPRTKHN